MFKPRLNERSWQSLAPEARPLSITGLNRPRWLFRTVKQARAQRLRAGGTLDASGWRSALRPTIDRPIFIVGSPRSGTTFLGDCLAAAPDIAYFYEPYATQAAARMFVEGEWDEARTAQFFRQAYGWLLRSVVAHDVRLADKTPAHVFILPMLHRAFPDAKFVHIVRDGRDVALSLTERHWLRAAWARTGRRYPTGELQGPFAPFYVERDRVAEFESTSDLHRAIWVWRLHTVAGRAAVQELGRDVALEIRYEDIVADPSGSAELLVDFLALAGDSAKALTETMVDVRSSSQGRWRTALHDSPSVVEREAGRLLRELGYT